jgi:hypothetical protein
MLDLTTNVDWSRSRKPTTSTLFLGRQNCAVSGGQARLSSVQIHTPSWLPRPYNVAAWPPPSSAANLLRTLANDTAPPSNSDTIMGSISNGSSQKKSLLAPTTLEAASSIAAAHHPRPSIGSEGIKSLHQLNVVGGGCRLTRSPPGKLRFGASTLPWIEAESSAGVR